MLRVKELFHSYTHDDKYAVNGISFEIQRGEIFGFLGPNGAGKSTVQKILIGLLPLQKGQASIDGTDVRKPTSRFFNMIGVSFEQPNLYKKLTGYENLDFFRKMYSVPTNDSMELLRMFGLESAACKRAGNYSKGMQQRLVLARSLVNKPRMWFLDEPTSGLDPATANQVKEIIRKKQQEGTTVFLTTHNMQTADELCDRVAFINEGKIELIDSPRNLKLSHGEKLVTVEYRENGALKRQSLSMTQENDRVRFNQLMQDKSIDIETMHSQEATLEEIFIKVTGRGLK